MFTQLFFLFFIILSCFHSPFSVSLSSLPLHLFFIPPQTHKPFFLPHRPSLIYMSPAAIDPSLLTHTRPPTWPISASLLYFRRFDFVFRTVLVFWLCVLGCAYVSALCFSGWVCVSSCDFFAFFFFLLHWFWCARRGCACVSALIFLLSFFCSSSLVLIGTAGLWLCSDFYGFDGGCGCGCGYVLVVE